PTTRREHSGAGHRPTLGAGGGAVRERLVDSSAHVPAYVIGQGFHVTHHRDRRAAQRRQEHVVQRAHQGGGAGGQLPVRHHRAERRRGRATGRAAGRTSGDVRV